MNSDSFFVFSKWGKEDDLCVIRPSSPYCLIQCSIDASYKAGKLKQ